MCYCGEVEGIIDRVMRSSFFATDVTTPLFCLFCIDSASLERAEALDLLRHFIVTLFLLMAG